MGWLKTLIKIYIDHIRVQWVNFFLEMVWTGMNIAITLLLWQNVIKYLPSGWTDTMLLTFALFLELWVSVRGVMVDFSWSIVDIHLFGLSHLLTKPKSLIFAYMKELNSGELTALLIKLLTFIPILLVMWGRLVEVAVGLLIMILTVAGTELFFASTSAILHSRGSLWRLFYHILWRLVVIPGDLFKGPLRILVTTLIPVYVATTVPAKLVAGVMKHLPIFFLISMVWFLIGVITTKKAMKMVEAFGG